mgnify:FL=1
MIELIDFSKTYGNKTAVDNVTLTVKQGEIAALLGENGAGKTTILKALCALHKATSGTVRICGKESATEIKEIVGYVPEQPILYDDFTVNEMLFFTGEMRGMREKALSEAMEKVIVDCKLESVINKKIATLSKGFKQRVSFATALIHSPKVLVLDEVTSGLDPAQIKQMRELIKRLSKTKTVLLSTHLMQEVDALAKTVFILKQGKLIAQGSAESIIRETKTTSLEEAFIALNQVAE